MRRRDMSIPERAKVLEDEQREVELHAREHRDADRFAFLADNWNSWLDNLRLYEWVEENNLRYGGLRATLDEARARAHGYVNWDQVGMARDQVKE